MHSIWHWIAQNPVWTLIIVGAIDNVFVAVTPRSLQKKRWYGWLVLLAHRLAILTHVDQPGTVQWPLIAKEIVFGALKAEPKPDVVAGDATADTTVPVAIVPDEKGPKP